MLKWGNFEERMEAYAADRNRRSVVVVGCYRRKAVTDAIHG